MRVPKCSRQRSTKQAEIHDCEDCSYTTVAYCLQARPALLRSRLDLYVPCYAGPRRGVVSTQSRENKLHSDQAHQAHGLPSGVSPRKQVKIFRNSVHVRVDNFTPLRQRAETKLPDLPNMQVRPQRRVRLQPNARCRQGVCVIVEVALEEGMAVGKRKSNDCEHVTHVLDEDMACHQTLSGHCSLRSNLFNWDQKLKSTVINHHLEVKMVPGMLVRQSKI